MSRQAPYLDQPPRLYLDVSTLLRWTGPPVGILRVEAALARHALITAHRMGFAFFDPGRSRYRGVPADIIRDLLNGRLVIDASHVPDPRPRHRTGMSRVFHEVAQCIYPLRRPRRVAVLALERLRLAWPSSSSSKTIGAVQERLFSARYRRMLFDQDGKRRRFIPIGKVLGPAIALGPDCIILSAGAEWNTKAPAALVELKSRYRYRYVLLCHDLIPLKFPRFFMPHDVAAFSSYFKAALRVVDRFICVSNCTANDLLAYAKQEDVSLLDVQVEANGADPPLSASSDLPDALVHRKFVLFVSTIEPRKNHALIQRVWLQLLARGIPQATGFKLVFVGRLGWKMEELTRSWQTNETLRSTLVHLQDLPDSSLASLYNNAAFCIYPSLYEGFGLPVLEAFSYGRAVIASTAGSLPEVMQDRGPTLDPMDEQAWYETMAAWITRPDIVDAHETKLTGFRPSTWEEAAARIVHRATRPFQTSAE
jgi:glycosyltransferase involved in cell wall biosynthesis